MTAPTSSIARTYAWLAAVTAEVISSHLPSAPPAARPGGGAGHAAGTWESGRAAVRSPLTGAIPEQLEHAAIATLPPHQRVVLELHDQKRLTYRQISSTLGVPEGTVHSRVARARVRVRDEIDRLRRERIGPGAPRPGSERPRPERMPRPAVRVVR